MPLKNGWKLIGLSDQLSVRSEFAELGRIDAREAVGGGAEQVIEAIAVEDGDTAAAFFEGCAHVFRKEIVAVVFLRVLEKELIVEVNEFLAIGWGDLVEIADDPADRFEVPVVGEPDKAVVGGDVGGEGELAAAEGAEVALAVFGTTAGHQVHIGWGFGFHLGHVDGVGGALVAAQTVPKASVGLEVSPLFFQCHRHCHADIAAKGFAGGVVGCA